MNVLKTCTKQPGDCPSAFLAAVLIAVLALATGCAQSLPAVSSAGPQEQDAPFLSFQDDAHREVTLPKQPERIIVLSPQLLNLLYAVGGNAIARATSTGEAVLPEHAENLESVGRMTAVNTERLLALKPDLVMGSTVFHRELAGILDASEVPFALFDLATYPDLKKKAVLFGKFAGTESQANEALVKLERALNDVIAKVPAHQAPTFIMLNVTPNSLSIQRQNTVGLEVAAMLNMENAAETLASSPSLAQSPSTAPFSLEKIVELDPDFMFILIHGARAEGESKIQADLAGQPAWASLRAVQENRMFILPSDLFLSHPGFRLNESLEYLAKLVYPDAYGHAH